MRAIRMTGSEAISIRSVAREEWPAIAGCFADYSYEQSPDYALAMAERAGAAVEFLAVSQGDAILGAASVRLKLLPLVGRGGAYVSGGPMTEGTTGGRDSQRLSTVLAALRRRLVEEAGHFLFVRPPLATDANESINEVFVRLGFKPTQRVRSYRTIRLQLKPEVQLLRKGLAGKWRTDLNFAQRCGLIVERGTDQRSCERFLQLFAEMHQVKAFELRVDPGSFLSLPAQRTGVEVLIATKDGKDAAGHVISLLGNTAVYLFGATNVVGRETKAGYLLNWHAMLLAKERGFTYYDLGGIDPDENPGGYRFKKRTGGLDVSAKPYEARPADRIATAMDYLWRLREWLKRS